MTEFESAPAVFFNTHSEVESNQFPVFIMEFVTRFAVDEVDAEILLPIVTPFLFIKAFDCENKSFDSIGDSFKPIVIFYCVS